MAQQERVDYFKTALIKHKMLGDYHTQSRCAVCENFDLFIRMAEIRLEALK